MKTALFVLASLSVAIAGCASTPSSSTPAAAAPAPKSTAQSASVNLASASGSLVSGKLAVMTMADGVHITGEVGGLPPGSVHGFHIHEKGDCSAADASSAGGHFNPAGTAHGNAEAGARLLVEHMALALQACVLLRANSPAAMAFCRSRLGGEHGLALGTLPTDAGFGGIIERAVSA